MIETGRMTEVTSCGWREARVQLARRGPVIFGERSTKRTGSDGAGLNGPRSATVPVERRGGWQVI